MAVASPVLQILNHPYPLDPSGGQLSYKLDLSPCLAITSRFGSANFAAKVQLAYCERYSC
ncbi:uncharacterized protein LOC110225289 [Arabidopsis lyrata subsp. lyrata]|uniref:uncharacterized protein LOC110225289 n=1 Tax=Arabidopsis lyrata subsp. lyrata TaxID=81972 RepID=UPI000A29E5FC|nr:uncharacterized protein LOC110225289 [Arabidopsis lyrata subsp. lyrata]|eukprot:XP_020870305.1 uncharacterized protein LOC110225289 [Arabidopsis lyrata subsp. lyrata]